MIFAFFGRIGMSEKKETDVIPLIGKKKSVYIPLGFIMKTMTMRYYLQFLNPMSTVIIGGVIYA